MQRSIMLAASHRRLGTPSQICEGTAGSAGTYELLIGESGVFGFGRLAARASAHAPRPGYTGGKTAERSRASQPEKPEGFRYGPKCRIGCAQTVETWRWTASWGRAGAVPGVDRWRERPIL